MSIEAPKIGKWNTDRRNLVGILGGSAFVVGLAAACPWIAGAVADFIKRNRTGEGEDLVDDNSLFAVGRIFLITEASGNEELSDIGQRMKLFWDVARGGRVRTNMGEQARAKLIIKNQMPEDSDRQDDGVKVIQQGDTLLISIFWQGDPTNNPEKLFAKMAKATFLYERYERTLGSGGMDGFWRDEISYRGSISNPIEIANIGKLTQRFAEELKTDKSK